MSSILCIFGSTGGNTELVVTKVAEVLKSKNHTVTVQRVENSSLDDLKNNDLCILGASTYGHGLIQDHFIPFAKELKKMDLSGKRFAIIGLGDNKYDAEYHIESARILEKIVKASGGERVCPSLKISKSPLSQLNTKVQEWAEELSQILKDSKK